MHSASKLFFAYGLGNAMTFPLSVGATAALWPHRPSPEGVFETMRAHRPTIFYGVPSLYTALLSHQRHLQRAPAPTGCASASRRARPCLRISASAGATRSGVDVLDGLGSTEMLQHLPEQPPERHPLWLDWQAGARLRRAHRRRAWARDSAIGEIGELIVRGPSAGEGYWNQRGKSRRTFAGEWTHTGDKYRRDAEGYYYYCGRTDDMFKVSGMWVSPFDVEAALVSHEAVLEAAVIGKEDADGLIKPKAFIVLKEWLQGR